MSECRITVTIEEPLFEGRAVVTSERTIDLNGGWYVVGGWLAEALAEAGNESLKRVCGGKGWKIVRQLEAIPVPNIATNEQPEAGSHG